LIPELILNISYTTDTCRITDCGGSCVIKQPSGICTATFDDIADCTPYINVTIVHLRWDATVWVPENTPKTDYAPWLTKHTAVLQNQTLEGHDPVKCYYILESLEVPPQVVFSKPGYSSAWTGMLIMGICLSLIFWIPAVLMILGFVDPALSSWLLALCDKPVAPQQSPAGSDSLLATRVASGPRIEMSDEEGGGRGEIEMSALERHMSGRTPSGQSES